MAKSRICSVDGCGKPHEARDLCAFHYLRWRRHGDPHHKEERTRSICSIDGCEKYVVGHGYCSTHYARLRKSGDVTKGHPPKPDHCTAGGCSAPVRCKGLCKVHYKRLQCHGDANATVRPKGPPRDKINDFLKMAVSYQGYDCLFWPFQTKEVRKNRITLKFGEKMQVVSRYVCELAHGAPPVESYDAAHSCGNGHLNCMNARHLRWATKAENQADRLIHGTDIRGEKSPSAVLNRDDVMEIRRRLAAGETDWAIAGIYAVSRTCIQPIKHRRSWGWLE